jgi:hypothetical protein
MPSLEQMTQTNKTKCKLIIGLSPCPSRQARTVYPTDDTDEVLDSVDVRASNRKIVNLSANEHAVPFVCTLVEAALMRC